jgi:outer membrane protein assembly factor BamD
VRSYDELGMTQLRDDSKRVMEKTYPKSEYLSRGFKSKQDPWWKLW